MREARRKAERSLREPNFLVLVLCSIIVLENTNMYCGKCLTLHDAGNRKTRSSSYSIHRVLLPSEHNGLTLHKVSSVKKESSSEVGRSIIIVAVGFGAM